MRIIGTGSAMPTLSVTNDNLSVFLNTSDEWISARTGIKERRILSNESLEDLGTHASLRAIEDAGLKPTDIDYILCSNVVNNFVTPGLSCILQGRIEANCPCVDLNAACSGFVYALDIAESFLETGRAENILIVCAEQPTRLVSWNDRNTCILFGDGAGAVVVSKGEGFKASHLTTTSKVEPLYYQRKMEYNPFVQHPDGNAPLVMNGRDVFKIAVSSSISDIKTVINKANLTTNDIKFFVLHQANLRIIESIRDLLDQPTEKFPHNVEKYGNTSSATIPILLDELHKSNTLKKGDMLLFSAFGAGFTTGALVLEWTKE